MSKPYWSGTRGGSTYADGHADGELSSAAGHDTRYSGYRTDTSGVEDYDAYSGRYSGTYTNTYADPETDTGADIYGESYDDTYEDYDHRDNRWKYIAGIAAIVLFVTVVAIATVLGNDSATSTTATTETTATGAPAQDTAAPSTTPRTVIATVPPTSAAPAPTGPLAPETLVTVTPSATHPGPVEPPPPAAEAPAPDRTITYTVTGNRQLFDLVTIIYTDEQGFPRTDIGVALPWTRTVVLNPGVTTQSVTATSISGQLNCAITDGAGATVIAQNNNSLIATCTK